MSSVLFLLENLNESDVEHMIREYESMPKDEYALASRHARTAAATLRKPTWMLWANCHVNALLLGLRRLRYEETYSVIRLIAAVEIYSFAVIGQAGLTYYEYNLAIGPVASILAPDAFADEQSWNIEEVKEPDFPKPYRPASYRSSVGRKVIAASEAPVSGQEKILAQALTAARKQRKQVPVKVGPSDRDLLQIMGVKNSS